MRRPIGSSDKEDIALAYGQGYRIVKLKQRQLSLRGSALAPAVFCWQRFVPPRKPLSPAADDKGHCFFEGSSRILYRLSTRGYP
jgi:hypothetical protein